MAWLLIYAIAVPIAILLYVRAAESRKRYTCASCGERVTVELMDAGHCNTCGAPFEPRG